MASPQQTLDRNRRDLVARERAELRELLRVYGVLFRRLRAEERGLAALIAEAAEHGTDASRWLNRQRRTHDFLALLEQQLAQFTIAAERHIRAIQSGHAQQAIRDVPDLAQSMLGPAPSGVQVSVEFRPPHPNTVLHMIGTSGDGTPLRLLLDEVARDAAGKVRDELLAGVARGQSPRVTARRIVRQANIAPNRALTISRTETLRTYREVSRQGMLANQGVVQGWEWRAQFGRRTCAMCWAMSGKRFTADESMDTHPNCRCAMLPVTLSWEELGFRVVPDNRPSLPTGAEAFDALTATDRRAILGPAKAAAYEAGDLALDDLVRPTRSARWGRGRREASLAEAIAA
jgi:SPP1 gp7 family putative phage head morphogenesis protein